MLVKAETVNFQAHHCFLPVINNTLFFSICSYARPRPQHLMPNYSLLADLAAPTPPWSPFQTTLCILTSSLSYWARLNTLARSDRNYTRWTP